MNNSKIKYLKRKLWKRIFSLIDVSNYYVYLSYFPDSFRNEYFRLFRKLKKLYNYRNKGNNRGDYVRLISVILNLSKNSFQLVEGDFVEIGVYKGNLSAVLAEFARNQNRSLHCFDTFKGFSPSDLKGVDKDHKIQFLDTSLEVVKNFVGENSVYYYEGFFPDTFDINTFPNGVSFVSIDCDLYAPIKSSLELFFPILNSGGLIFIHDYSSGNWAGAKKALDEFCLKNELHFSLLPDKSGTAVLLKN